MCFCFCFDTTYAVSTEHCTLLHPSPLSASVHVVTAVSIGCLPFGYSLFLGVTVQVTDHTTSPAMSSSLNSLSALSAGCCQLQSINLGGCSKVTDAGISALSAGCGQLKSVNLRCCLQVTDAGISALSAGFSYINLGGCSKVTDAGISALSAGCCQLHKVEFGQYHV